MNEPFNLSLSPIANKLNTPEGTQYSTLSQAHHNSIYKSNKDFYKQDTNDILNRTITESDNNEIYHENLLEILKLKKNLRSNLMKSENPKQKNEGKKEIGRWNLEEHQNFLEGLMLFGNEWKLVQGQILTRTATQARSHAQKFFIKLRKELLKIKTVEQIKERICQIFSEGLGERFKPDDIESFLNMMIKLIFASEKNIKYLQEDLEEKKKRENMIKKKKVRNDEIFKKFKKSKVLNENDEKDDIDGNSSEILNREKIFSISKDDSRKKSFSMLGLPQEDLKNDIGNKSPNKQPTAINFVTINMVNNSYNQYINQGGSLSMMDTELNMINPNNTQKFKESYSGNPFDLEFEQLIENNMKQSSNINNGFQFQDDKYIEDIMALFN